jgi:ankyrin repeat protein
MVKIYCRWLLVAAFCSGSIASRALATDAILWAAHNGDTDGVKAALAKGADINDQDASGWTPLIHATKFGFNDTALFLINAGANVNAQTNAECEAVEFACNAGDLDLVKAIVAHGGDAAYLSNNTNILCGAVESGNLELVKFLLDRGANPNAKVQDYMPTIFTAVRNGDQDLFELLVARGADIHATDGDGWTLLSMAAKAGNLPLLKRLVASGLDVNAAAGQSGTPLSAAAKTGHLDCLQYLLAHGADPAGDNNSAATGADSMGQVDAYKLLTAAGGVSHLASDNQDSLPPQQDYGAPGGISTTAALLAPIDATPSASPAPVRKPGALRMAILSDDPSDPVASIVTAELSDKFDLLERNDIDSLATEQQLARSGFAARDSLAGIGHLLHAQAMVLFDEQYLAGRDVQRVRLVSAVTGVVLDSLYQTLPVADPVAFARTIARRTEALTPKLAVPPDQMLAVSLLNIRLATDVPGGGEIETNLNSLLEHQLIHEPRIFLLDRTEMDRLTAEAADNDFRGGDYLLDGEIDPDLAQPRHFTLKLRVRAAGPGAKPAEIALPGDADHLPEAVASALDKMRPLLKLAGRTAPWDHAAEAQDYYQEAVWADTCGFEDRAGAAAGSAWALGLHTQAVAALRVRGLTASFPILETTILDHTIQCQSQPFVGYAAFDAPERPAEQLPAARYFALATQALDIYDDLSVRGAVTDEEAWADTGEQLFKDASAPLIALTTASSQIAFAKEAAQLRQRVRETADDVLARKNNGSRKFEAEACSMAANARWWCETPEQFTGLEMRLLNLHFNNDVISQAAVRSRMVGACNGWVNFGGEHTDQRWFRPGEPTAFWSALAAKLAPDADPGSQVVRNGIGICMEGNRAARFAAAAGLEKSLLDLRHQVATAPDAFDLYWSMIQQFKMNDWAVSNMGLCEDFSNPSFPNVYGTPEYYKFYTDYFISMLQEADDVPMASFYTLIVSPFTVAQRKSVDDALVAFLARRRAAHVEPACAMAIQQVLRSHGVSADADQTYPVIKLGKFWTPSQIADPAHYQLDELSSTDSEGKLWFCGSCGSNGKVSTYIFAINPGTLDTETIPIPRSESTYNNHSLTITRDYIFYAQQDDALGVYNRARKAWSFYDGIQPNGQPMAWRGDTLYLTTLSAAGSSILAFHPSTQATDIIASTRRRPAQSPLDEADIQIVRVWMGQDGTIYPIATRPDPVRGPQYGVQVHEFYNTTTHHWTATDEKAGNDLIWHATPHLLDPDGERWALMSAIRLPGPPLAHGGPKEGQTMLRYFSRSKNSESRVILEGVVPLNPIYRQPGAAGNGPCTVFVGDDFLACFDGQENGFWIIPRQQLAPSLSGKGISLAMTP